MRVPFNLELFRKHNSDVNLLEYRTSTNKIINCFVAEHLVDICGAFPIITTNNGPSRLPITHCTTGNVYGDDNPHNFDLFINIPETIVETWGNVYENGFIHLFDNKFLCDANVLEDVNRLGYIKVIVNETTGEYTVEKVSQN